MSRRRTSKNAVNARTNTEPKATPPPQKKTPSSIPSYTTYTKIKQTLPRLPTSAKQEEERKQPRKNCCCCCCRTPLHFNNTRFLSLPLSLSSSVPPIVFYCQFCDVAKSEDRP